MAEVVRCEVIGDLPIVDYETGEDRYKGDIVTLMPAVGQPTARTTVISALVECGLVKVVTDEKPAKLKKAL